MPRARLLWAALVSCAAILLWSSICSAQEEVSDTRSCEELTADWPLWSALSQHPWTQAETDQKIFFSLERMKATLRAVPMTAPVHLVSNETEDYAQEKSGQPGVQAYSAAAAAYKAGDYKTAVPLFDKIVADRTSGYRAAAAYTAARATMLSGDLAMAATRIDALVRDPTLREFAGPAYDLFSKIRHHSSAVTLNAAEMSEISFLLTAPTQVVCSSADGEQLRRKFDGEFGRLIETPYDANRWNRFSLATIASTVMVRLDPVIDAASVLGQASFFDSNPYKEDKGGSGDTVRPDFLAHLRARWDTTRNPLWAVALAERTVDAADIDRLITALSVLRKWPALAPTAQVRYAWRIVAQIVRLRLVAGKVEDAVAAASLLTADDLAAAKAVHIQPDIVRARDFILAGGIRWFMALDDFESARKWGLAAAGRFDIPIPEVLKPSLVRNLDELYRDSVLGLRRTGDHVELGNFRAIFDIYSSPQLIEISRRPDIAEDDRRAFVGAAWTRAYMRNDWDDVMGWLPDMEKAFPELEGDIDNIRRAWFTSTKRHRAALLVLKAPGLVYLPSWSRPPGGPPRHGFVNDDDREADIRKFDYDNPSDGNWWCSPDPPRIRAIAAISFVEIAADEWWFPDLYQFPLEPGKLDRAPRTLANYPLLKAADWHELDALADAGSATEQLANATVERANSMNWFDRLFRRDRDVPEALARAVAATRYGCRRPAENGPWSRAAYELLHRNYPDSDWAKRTKYWFDTVHQ